MIDLNSLFDKRPLIIAGPCSAETEEQTIETARQLAANGIKVFRAGIWKPRTRPGNFEGIGTVGLPWMQRVKEETGMVTSTEVANTHHVEEAVNAGIDIIWIGARTSANPFAMQEIADCLKGVEIPVLVKNPVNPDVDLWLGAVERLQDAGIKQIGLIHRGFSSYEKILYRNAPLWQIPIEMKRRRPDLHLICDPSHIAGKREYLFEIAQKALDLNVDGLMIESHINPDKAWSDAKQQLTPAALQEMLGNLIIRDIMPQGISPKLLDELRAKIDVIDDLLIDLLKKRMSISEGIGRYKKENKMAVLQPARWDSLLNKYMMMAGENSLSRELITKIFQAIHQESINIQDKIINPKK
ncbi:MAG: bifunctional 3-deoxy-7-phosphoheptulonate synthase/chorismate mutase type II [Bacteroidales bacterium]|nr:bifunctional 3-deoxy-7-phosphoheptulonate synthase/chorismate mutase type II [Bacteroidales bacterium]